MHPEGQYRVVSRAFMLRPQKPLPGRRIHLTKCGKTTFVTRHCKSVSMALNQTRWRKAVTLRRSEDAGTQVRRFTHLPCGSGLSVSPSQVLLHSMGSNRTLSVYHCWVITSWELEWWWDSSHGWGATGQRLFRKNSLERGKEHGFQSMQRDGCNTLCFAWMSDKALKTLQVRINEQSNMSTFVLGACTDLLIKKRPQKKSSFES